MYCVIVVTYICDKLAKFNINYYYGFLLFINVTLYNMNEQCIFRITIHIVIAPLEQNVLPNMTTRYRSGSIFFHLLIKCASMK